MDVVIAFLLGLIIGGTFGVISMALFQINREDDR